MKNILTLVLVSMVSISFAFAAEVAKGSEGATPGCDPSVVTSSTPKTSTATTTTPAAPAAATTE